MLYNDVGVMFEVYPDCYLLPNSEVGGRTLLRLLCRDAGGETEQMLLGETVPPWVVDITVEVSKSF